MNPHRIVPQLLLLAVASTGALGAPGDLDPGFNGTGKVVTVVPTGFSQGRAVARQSDGKILVAGTALVPEQGSPDNLDFVVVRYDAAGMPDATFGGDGIVTTAVRDGEDTAEAVIQQADGKIVAAGVSYDAGFNDSTLSLVRYLDDGSPDPGFGGGTGKVTTAVGMGTFDAAFAVIQQADGKLVVAGYTDTDIVVARYETDGDLDGTFNGTGVVTTTVGSSAVANALLQQATDDKLVVAGAADADIVLVRYGTTGTPDATFNGTGVVTTTIGSGNAEAHALVQQAADGKLVVAGVSNDGTNDQFTLARYELGGGLDTTGFGTGGVATTTVGMGNAEAFGLAEQADGKLVAAGVAVDANKDFALVRYGTDGMPDAGFGTGGVVLTPIGTGNDDASAIVYQPDGFLVAAGSAAGTPTSIAAARYVGIEGIVTTTSTSTTSTTGAGGTTSSTSTTLPVVEVLFPGGPSSKADSDCLLEILVSGATASQITGGKLLVCTDGDPCDSGPAGDDRCDLRIAGCVNQMDSALPCTPPPALASAKIRGKISIDVSALLTGAQCTPFVDAPVTVKRNKKGKALAGKSKLVLKGLAKAPKGVTPKKDADKWTFQCLPSS